MPVPCKKPRYAYKNDVRLTFCGNKVVEAKKKKIVMLERRYGRKIHIGKKGGMYYIKNNKMVYV